MTTTTENSEVVVDKNLDFSKVVLEGLDSESIANAAKLKNQNIEPSGASLNAGAPGETVAQAVQPRGHFACGVVAI